MTREIIIIMVGTAEITGTVKSEQDLVSFSHSEERAGMVIDADTFIRDDSFFVERFGRFIQDRF